MLSLFSNIKDKKMGFGWKLPRKKTSDEVDSITATADSEVFYPKDDKDNEENQITEKTNAIDQDEVFEPILENTSWKRYVWDTWGHPDKNHQKVIFKLDCTLLFFACASTFVKYLDKINLTYAYVNGLKEELGIKGNEYNYANTGYNIASMVIGFPAAFLMVQMNTKYFLILIEIIWTIITFAQSSIKTPVQLIVTRTLLGIFECGHYPALSYILGTYYSPFELAKRAVILQASTSIGSFFGGYVASGVYTGLNGVSNRSGWRWVFIIDGVISVGLIGAQIFFFPDRLSNRKPDFILTEADINYLKNRLPEQKVDNYKFKFRDIFSTLTDWRIWSFWFFGVFQDITSLTNPFFSLWLKAWNKKKPGSYTIPQINHYASIIYAVQTVLALSSGWLSDTVLRGRRWPPIIVAGCVAFAINICLGATPLYPHNRAFRFFLYCNTGWALGTAGLYWAWAQEVFKTDVKKRVICTGGINIFAFVANSICNNIWYKTANGPHITAGYYLSGVCGMLYASNALLLGIFDHKRLVAVRNGNKP